MEYYNETIANNPAVEMVWYPREDEESAEQWASKENFPWPTVRGKSLEKVKPVSKRAGNAVPHYVLVSAENEVVATGFGAIKRELSRLLEE